MDLFTTFQDLIQVGLAVPAEGPQTNEVVQSRSGHLDMADGPSVGMHVEVFDIAEGCTLLLETGISEEGPWMELASWTWVATEGPAVGEPIDTVIELTTHHAAEHPLARFVRWRVTQVDQAGGVSFRMSYLARLAA